MDKLNKVQIIQDLDAIDNILRFNESEANFAKSKGLRKLLDNGRITFKRLVEAKRVLTDKRNNYGNDQKWGEPSGDDLRDIQQWVERKGEGAKFNWALEWRDEKGKPIKSSNFFGVERTKYYVQWGSPEDGDVLSVVWVDTKRGQVRQSKVVYQRDIDLISLTKSGKLLFRDR